MKTSSDRDRRSGTALGRAASGRIQPRISLLVFVLLGGCGGSIAAYEPEDLARTAEHPSFSDSLPALPPNAPPPPRPVERKPTVTLEEAVFEALAQAPEVLAGTEAIIQARADLKTASTYPNPTFTAGTTLQPAGTHFTASNSGGPPQYSFDLNIPLDPLVFGKQSAGMESARRAVDVAGADQADLKRARAGDVASSFYDVLQAKALLLLVREDLENLKRVEALTRRRVDLGGAPAVDLDRARLAVANSQQDVRTAESLELSSRATLRALLGRTGSEPGFDVAGSLEIPHPLVPPDLESVLKTAEQFRADLVSLRRQVERWLAEARSQGRQGLPQLSVTGGYIYQVQDSLGLKNQNEWEAMVGISLPLFDRNQGNIAKAESQARQANYTLEAKRAAVRAELAQDLSGFQAAQAAAVADDRTQLDAAKSVRDRMEAAYQAGGRTVLELLDAERAYRDAQRLHIGVQSAYWHSLYRINAAAGTTVLKDGGR
ncbi:MAG TPA: TolC family protein [Planctomycetota bacterium]|nr:TolC family protein [Planctomycetota bacterium]